MWVAMLSIVTADESRGWQPSGWVYHTSPFAYSLNDGDWHYLDEGSYMWAFGYDTGAWQLLHTLSPTWIYFDWPHGFVLHKGGWYWMNSEDRKWCYSYTTGTWSLFGQFSPPSDMALIPAGSFQMGDPFDEGWYDELPVHEVYISAFYMDQYEVTNDKMAEILNWAHGQGMLTVTQTEFETTVVNAEGDSRELLNLNAHDCRIEWNGSQFVMKSTKSTGHPCVNVTWYGAAAYCNYRTLKEGGSRIPCYDFSDWSCNWSATGYRLPTEAEWEKAARGGLSGQRFPWGPNINHDYANYEARGDAYTYDTSFYTSWTYHPDYDDSPLPYTSPVGSFAANGYRLYDMAGNVAEWCNDWYLWAYYETSPDNNPRGPASSYNRSARGGGWMRPAYGCRNADRACNDPAASFNDRGFRTIIPAAQ